jgi:hypothetical protein
MYFDFFNQTIRKIVLIAFVSTKTKIVFGNVIEIVFLKNLKINFLFKINFFIFSNRFDMLRSKIIFLKIYIILIYFRTKNTLNRNHYQTLKHPLNLIII